MALVSSLSPSSSPYDLSSSPYSKAGPSEPLQIRALPTLPQAASSSATGLRRPSPSTSSAGPGTSPNGAGGASAGAPSPARRPLPSPSPIRSPSAPSFLERIPPPRTGSANNSGAPASFTVPAPPSRSPQPSPSYPRPSSAAAGSSRGHSPSTSSSSASSLPRVPAPIAQMSLGPSSASSGSPHSNNPYPPYPSSPYNTAPFPPAPFHHYPNPQYPFIPSPHPHQLAGYPGGPGPYSPGFNQAADQHQARLIQQAQFQQQQWAHEMLRNQQQSLPGGAFDWGGQQQQFQQQGQNARRRATSGPAPSQPHSAPPPFFPPSLANPPSPSPSLHQPYPAPSQGPPVPSFPAGAMLQNHIHGGYPTPPASVEGSRESSRDGYHPYRRGTAPAGKGPEDAAAVAQQGPPKIRALPTPGAQQLHQAKASSAPLSSSLHARAESNSGIKLSLQNFPPLPTRAGPSKTPSPQPPSQQPVYPALNSSHGKTGSTSSLPPARSLTPTSQRSTPEHPPFPSARIRTDSNITSSSASSSIRPAPPRERERTESVSSIQSVSERGRSPTPTGQSTSAVAQEKKPSPLSRSATPTPGDPRPGTPGTVRGGHGDDEDSDDTTSATVSGSNLAQDKKGIKSKFKKAFSISHSTSSSTLGSGGLTEAELDGTGARDAKAAPRWRTDSQSSQGSEAVPRMPPPQAGPSTSRPPSAGGRRFGGILNPKLNSSTDNISISSTVSSASVMIRKLGQMGKLARRNSLMSLTKAFKGKDKDGDDAPEPKASKKDKRKGQVATATTSHVTAEIESSHTAGMSPAAALAKKHQLQYAEQEAAQLAAAAAKLAPPRSFAVHARTDSNASDASSVRSPAVKSGWGRSKTTDDVVEGGAARARAAEKEKEKLKSRKPRKWGVFGGGSSSLSPAPLAEPEVEDSEGPAEDDDDAATPRQSFDGLAPPPQLAPLAYTSYGGSYFEDDGQELESPPARGEDEYEPSMSGTPPVGHHRDAKAVRGILKGAGTYNQEDYASPRRSFGRNRANSFDAPQQQGRLGSPGNAALVGKIPSEAQVDGVVPSATSHRTDTIRPSATEVLSSPSSPPTASTGSPYSNASLNASAPTLHQPFGTQPALRTTASASSVRRLVFAQNLSVHTTWPATVYDRRAEPSTSNRLTPALAQRIKEELNAFKMEEMEVHPGSRQLTHFFV